MTGFEDRERAEEAKFAHDADVLFRIQARRNKLLGQWAAQRMDLDAAETDSYARAVVQAEFEEAGDEEVIRKVHGDLLMAGIDATEIDVRKALEAKAIEAKRQLLGDF